jgi:NADH dehydrogenase
MAAVDGVPGQAQGAIQGARYAARLIKAELQGADPTAREPFKYFDKGSMATVSRFSAVVQVGPLEFGGFIGWLSWLFLHLIYLVGFRARLTTALSWIGTFIGSRRGQLTITEQQAYARTRIEQLEEIVESVEETEISVSS